MPDGGDPSGTVDVEATVVVARVMGLARVQAHPDADVAPSGHGSVLSARCASAAAVTAAPASGKTANVASPSVRTIVPSCAATASRMCRWCLALTSSHERPSLRARTIEPSTSVRRKVTVPVGRVMSAC